MKEGRKKLLGKKVKEHQENLAMICDLAASIYRSSPSLCYRFWVDWDEFTNPERKDKDNDHANNKWPLCKIVDLAFNVVNRVDSGKLGDKRNPSLYASISSRPKQSRADDR